MPSPRTAVAAGSGAGVGALGALAGLHAGDPALAALLACGAIALAALGYAAGIWLDARRPNPEPLAPALVVFALSVALGLMIAGARWHG